MKRAAEAERKRHSGKTPNRPTIRRFGAGEQADQGRLAGAVDAENPKIVTGFEDRAGIVEHDLPTGSGCDKPWTLDRA